MRQRKTLQELCEERYDDDAVAKLVADDAVAHGTADRIIAGECTLPHPEDAYRHYLRVTGQEGVSAKERDMQQQITALNERLMQLETAPRPDAITTERGA